MTRAGEATEIAIRLWGIQRTNFAIQPLHGHSVFNRVQTELLDHLEADECHGEGVSSVFNKKNDAIQAYKDGIQSKCEKIHSFTLELSGEEPQ